MPENLPATIPSNAEISPLAARFAILNPTAAQEIRKVRQANMGARGVTEKDLDRIKVPTGGALSLIAQGIDGEEHLREIDCIILGWYDRRAYYKIPFDQRGKQQKGVPPDCTSRDGYIGVGDPGGQCAQCPMAAWGSDPKGGRGQACKESRQLIIMRADLDGAEIVTVPPTSLKAVTDYFRRLDRRRIPYYGLVTNLRLERAENADGMTYSRMVFSAGPQLSQTDRAAVEPMQVEMMQKLQNVAIDTEYEVVPDRGDFTPAPGEYGFAAPTDD